MTSSATVMPDRAPIAGHSRLTSQPATPSATSEPVRAEQVAPLGDNLSRLLRMFNRVRSQFLAAAQHNVEWSAHVLIAQLVNEGPLRVGALADCVQSDASTVSRQVAAMVKDGLIERRADPVDGRASLLVATEKARIVYADHVQLRNEHFARMLKDWSVQDCAQFSALLARFAEDFEHCPPQLAPATPEPGVGSSLVPNPD